MLKPLNVSVDEAEVAAQAAKRGLKAAKKWQRDEASRRERRDGRNARPVSRDEFVKYASENAKRLVPAGDVAQMAARKAKQLAERLFDDVFAG